MKEMIATAGSPSNPRSTRVQLNNVDDNEKLTPRIAHRAARIAFGTSTGVTVTDGKITYRLTRSGAEIIHESEPQESWRR